MNIPNSIYNILRAHGKPYPRGLLFIIPIGRLDPNGIDDNPAPQGNYYYSEEA